MSLRDILVALFILGSLPICFRRPFVGLLLFSVLAYMRLQDLTWGFAREQRWSLLVATVMVGGWFAAREKYPPVLSLRTGLLAFLVVWIGLGHFFAHGDAPIEWVGYIEYAKIVFIAIFTTALVRTREQLRIVLWVIAMSFAFYGVMDGVQGILRGGALYIINFEADLFSGNLEGPIFGYLAPIFESLFHSVSVVLLRFRSQSEDPIVVAFFANTLPALYVLPIFFLMELQPIDGLIGGYVIAAFLGVSFWSLTTLAYSGAPAAKLAPFTYTQLIWSALIGLTIFGEWPGIHTWIGASIIVAACLYVMRATSPQTPQTESDSDTK